MENRPRARDLSLALALLAAPACQHATSPSAGDLAPSPDDLASSPRDLASSPSDLASSPVDLATAAADLVTGCSSDLDCTQAGAPRCEVTTRRCVACLPASDNCPMGQYCHQPNGAYQCAAGCKSDGDCQVGGGADGGAVAGVPRCCNNACVDVASDAANCGGCGVSCGTEACCAGACTDTASDPDNCTQCGAVCAFPNGHAACSGGCVLASCAPDYIHCSNVAGDGCEVHAVDDPANCGACGNMCGPAAHAQRVCAASQCAIALCDAGFGDCDLDPTNGCEDDLGMDPMNCAACHTVCAAPPNATPGCLGGLCGVGACLTGYLDCNQMPGDGCEVAGSTDLANCGSCGHACPAVANGTPGCSGGACGVASCTTGFADCDANPGSGCETNVQTDNRNCGNCGQMCPAGNACQAGVCTLITCVRIGWKTGNADWSCPAGLRLPTVNDFNAVAPCITAGDQAMFGYYQDIGVSVGGCNCKWNANWCAQPSIETLRQGRTCGDYAQLQICIL